MRITVLAVGPKFFSDSVTQRPADAVKHVGDRADVVGVPGKHAGHHGNWPNGEHRDNDMSAENRLRSQGRSAKPFQNAALAIDGNDCNQREYGADSDQKRHKNREISARKTTGGK